MKKLLITALALVLVSAVAMAQNNRRNQRMNPADVHQYGGKSCEAVETEKGKG